ncbi:hypothetical protein [Paenibacillus roseipurpureus]|uniref:Uncharacterized protein n=1 Tax=Paenibacillus roseopurpureus TaxID=2918901 RepID=A0AA96LPS0_9BACL|nr:hypothetical protein [Paenibacillus sp. MBLB1832]WNR43734.1 hypothetical protein MJB10_21925 [Paenibacillus sp. MBLB1832]
MMEYALRKDKLTEVLKRSLLVSGIPLMIPILFFFTFAYRKDSDLPDFLQYVFVLLFVYYLYKAVRNLLKVRRDWYSFRIVLSDQSLVKKQRNVPDTTLSLNDITRIVQVTGGLSVEASCNGSYVFIPSHIENYDVLVERLRPLCVIETSPVSSVGVPAEFALKQHQTLNSTLTSIFKKFLWGIGIIAGIFLLFFLAIAALIFFLSH